MIDNEQKILLFLGEIKGFVEGLKDGQDLQNKCIDLLDVKVFKMDDWLCIVEQKLVVMGVLVGVSVFVGMVFIIEGLKFWVSCGGY